MTKPPQSFEKPVSPQYNDTGQNELVEKHYWQIISINALCKGLPTITNFRRGVRVVDGAALEKR
jgi:hypothetical protein